MEKYRRVKVMIASHVEEFKFTTDKYSPWVKPGNFWKLESVADSRLKMRCKIDRGRSDSL